MTIGVQPEMAQRWVVKAHIDDNVCDPCKANDGKLYRSRAAAWKDYPNGRGYKKCVGAQYGNTCRCTVLKRGRARNEGDMDLAQLIARAQAMTANVSGRSFAAAARVPTACAECRDQAVANVQDFRAEGNTLWLYDAIGGWDGTKAIDVAQALAGMTGPVTMRINSPGGLIFEGAAIYNAFDQYMGGPITAWVDGYAASAASFVMLAASPYDAAADTGGIRMAGNAFAMVHDGMGLAMGTQQDMYDMGDLLGMLSDSIAEIYAARTGQTAEHWREIMTDGDTWYNAAAALDAKLVDLIVGAPAPSPEPEPEPENRLDISMFLPGAPAPSNTLNLPFDIEGLRSALKGAFAE